MNKLIVSASLVTLGATGLQAAYAPGLSPMETSKPWSVAATVRGFYDDNYNLAPSHSTVTATAKSSGGFELSPSGRFNMLGEQTYIGIGAVYSLKYYFDRPRPKDDNQVELTIKADHRFSQQYKVSFDDSFIYAVEPEVAGTTLASFQKQNTGYLRNRAKADFRGQFTELLGFDVSYGNTWYDYLATEVDGSLPASLNRFEHLFDVSATWLAQEHLTASVGYILGIFDYTSDKFVVNPLSVPNPQRGTDRDNKSHSFYVGADYAFTSQLNASAKVGYQYTTYDKLSGTDSNPYADVRGTYTYLPGSFVQFGLSYTRNATDQVGDGSATGIVKDQQSATLFASVTHRITARITGNANISYQHSTDNGGINPSTGKSLDGSTDDYVLLSLNLQYRINNNWSTEIGYNLDNLDSELSDRSFTRNRIYAGVTANF